MSELESDKSYLAKRFEFKYIISPAKALLIEEYLKKVGLLPDDFSKDGAYQVHSIYFETPFLDDYHDKDGSYLTRKKLRVRWYGAYDQIPQQAWLEIKNKRNQMIRKERVKISAEAYRLLVEKGEVLHLRQATSLAEGDQLVIDRFCRLFVKGRYHPYVLVSYSRMAYLGNYLMPIRITFDREIQTTWTSNLFQGHKTSLLAIAPHNTVVMEVKFNGQLPWWFSQLLKMFELRRDSFSKYANSVTAIHNNYQIPISR